MTSSELVEGALRRLALPRTAAHVSRLSVMIPDALRRLPLKLKARGQDVEVYRKNYTVALTAGAGSLSSHTNLTSEPMIPEDIVKVTHTDAVTTENTEGKLQRVGSESALNGERSTAFAYYAIEDNTLYTMQDGDRTALGSNATVRAGFVPQLTSVKFQHDPYLIECLAELGGQVAASV